MPIRPVDRAPLPYVRPAYEPDTRTLLQLMQMAGQARAEAVGRKGQATAHGLMTLGQIVGGGLGQLRQEKEQAAQYADEQRRKGLEDSLKVAQFEALQQEREQNRLAKEEATRAAAEATAYTRGGKVADEIGYGPMSESQVDPVMQGPAAGRVRYSFGPGTAEGPELQPTREQQRGIAVEQSIQGMGGQIGPNGQVIMPPKEPVAPQPTEWSILMQAAGGDPNKALQLRRQQIAAGRESTGTEKPSVWVSKGSEMRFVTPTEASTLSRDGWRSGQSREQGRPVTSGDAGRIADLDTSLNDLNVLTNTVTGSTGTSAKIGASLPNWVTELTGRGISAKQKQAAIDRVKQVIGKALEGGVLRKEDEAKYEKILPTIYDAPEVVKSKLHGLQSALTLRRETQLEALADAGYDVSRFTERGAPKSTGGPFSVTAPDGSVHPFETQAQADAFKKLIGGGR